MEASEAIGIENDTKIHRISKKMTDYTFINEWDAESGAQI
jgi:hypothetical protein